MRHDLDHLPNNLNLPAENYAESHDWDGRGHTAHGLHKTHCHWKTRTHDEQDCLLTGEEDAESAAGLVVDDLDSADWTDS